MFDVCMFLADQINAQRTQATAVATKLGKACRSQKQKLAEKDSLIEELQRSAKNASDESIINEQTIDTNARLTADNLELQLKVTNLTNEINELLRSMDEQEEVTNNLRLTTKAAELRAETN